CVDRIARRLGRRDALGHPSRGAAYPGAPPDGTPWQAYREAAVREARGLGLAQGSSERLVEAYGARWRLVLDAGSQQQLVPAGPPTAIRPWPARRWSAWPTCWAGTRCGRRRSGCATCARWTASRRRSLRAPCRPNDEGAAPAMKLKCLHATHVPMRRAAAAVL